MNWSKFFVAFVVAFIFLFVFGFLWYATLMHSANEEVHALWRPEGTEHAYFGWLILGHIVMAFFFTLLCVRFVPGGGAGGCGLLGLLVALVYDGTHLITYAVQPITSKILWGWNLGALIQFIVAGAIIGAIYKPASRATA
jgi:hypothetical protein